MLEEAWLMNVSLTEELKDFVRRKIEDGEYPSEAAVIEAALKRFREQDNGSSNTMPTIDDLIDHEFVEYCVREADEEVTSDEVLEATSTINDSMARVIIEDERADRF
jgi:putative addiction module CopG family antidote